MLSRVSFEENLLLLDVEHQAIGRCNFASWFSTFQNVSHPIFLLAFGATVGFFGAARAFLFRRRRTDCTGAWLRHRSKIEELREGLIFNCWIYQADWLYDMVSPFEVSAKVLTSEDETESTLADFEISRALQSDFSRKRRSKIISDKGVIWLASPLPRLDHHIVPQ